MSLVEKVLKKIYVYVILSVAFVFGYSVDAQAKEASVEIEEDTDSLEDEGTITVQVRIQAEGDIGVYDVYLQYDNTNITYVSGAEEETDGVVRLVGTGFGDEVIYDNLVFEVKEGESVDLSVVETHIYPSNGDEAYVVPGVNDEVVENDIEDQSGYDLASEIPVLGSVQQGNQILYVVDLANYVPEIDMWNYQLILDDYYGYNITYITDQSHNVRVLLLMDEEEHFYLYAYSPYERDYYPVVVKEIQGQKYYAVSLATCLSLPVEMNSEDMLDASIFYGIDGQGVGGYYRMTMDETLVGWNDVNTSEENTMLFILQIVLIGIMSLLIVLITIILISLHIKHKKYAKREQFDLYNGRVENRKQYFFVIRELTSREIKRKYARSYLGIIWSVLNPLLTMVVISFVFSYMFRRSIVNFPLYYLTGYIIWSLFSSATNSAMTALVDNKNMLMKSKLPKHTFVLSRIYTAVINFGYTCIAFVLVMAFFRIRPTCLMLLFLLDVLMIVIFTTGIGYILSVLYVFFADIKYLYSVFLTMLMYISAIFYPVSSLPPKLQVIIGYNPVYMSMYIAREAVIYNHVPHYTAWLKLGVAALISILIGLYVFRKNENKIMQKV